MTKRKRDYNGYFSKPVADSYEEAEKLREEVEEAVEEITDEPVEESVEEALEEEEVNVEDITTIAIVLPEKLNVRVEPAQVDGNVIGIIRKGSKVTVHKAYENPTWAFVSAEIEKGVCADGYVMKGFIEEVKEG